MRTDAQNRIMSLSFQRDPKEHAEVMFSAGRRLMTPARGSSVWPFFAIAIAFGAIVGLAMEGYRRFVLSPLLGVEDVTPLNIIVLQLLPIFLLLVALLYGRALHVQQRRMRALTDRLQAGVFIDTDIYRDGVKSSSGPVTVLIEWTSIREILLQKTRIEFVNESFVVYIPERAFANRQAFQAAAKQFRQLWLEAKLRQSEMKDAAREGTETTIR
jgi:hypothetical protein